MDLNELKNKAEEVIPPEKRDELLNKGKEVLGEVKGKLSDPQKRDELLNKGKEVLNEVKNNIGKK